MSSIDWLSAQNPIHGIITSHPIHCALHCFNVTEKGNQKSFLSAENICVRLYGAPYGSEEERMANFGERRKWELQNPATGGVIERRIDARRMDGRSLILQRWLVDCRIRSFVRPLVHMSTHVNLFTSHTCPLLIARLARVFSVTVMHVYCRIGRIYTVSTVTSVSHATMSVFP